MIEFRRNLLIIILFLFTTLLTGCGKPQDRGVIAGTAIPAEVVQDKLGRQQGAAPDEGTDNQILFGDLHVHTTFHQMHSLCRCH